MISAVVDTNTLASGLIRRNPFTPVVQVVDAWRTREFRLVTSEHIITELARTIVSAYFAKHITPDQAQRFILLLRRRATITPITMTVSGVATHPEDDLILASAASAQVNYLVSGDRQLQRLGSYQGITIVSARDFIQLLNRAKRGQGT